MKTDICNLPRDNGGLGMIDFEGVMKVKRIKWMISLLNLKAIEIDNWSTTLMKFVNLFDHDLIYLIYL